MVGLKNSAKMANQPETLMSKTRVPVFWDEMVFRGTKWAISGLFELIFPNYAANKHYSLWDLINKPINFLSFLVITRDDNNDNTTD